MNARLARAPLALCFAVSGFRNAAGGGALVDLRYAAPATYAIFHNIVREGAYTGPGMPNLGAFLDEQEAEAIKQFILGRRAAAIAAQ